MAKPSIAELLNASGYTTYTAELVQRAMFTLYGNVGANQDGRNWAAILQSNNPLEAAEAGLRAMYQDGAYLRSNTQHLEQSGYVAAQAEITYRQLAERLDYTYNAAWSDGTAYDYLGDLTYEQLVSLVPASPPPPPLPTISVSASATGFTVSLNVAGAVKMSASGDLGNFAAGSTLLTEQATVKEGFLTLSANGQTSTATNQYVVLGTANDDSISIDTSAAGNRVNYIFGGAGHDILKGGAGNDTLKGGAGNDVIVGGAGNDIITGGDGADQLTGGAGADVFIYTTRDESYYPGAGTPLDTIADFATGTDKIRFSLSGSAVDASSFATVGNFVDGKNNSIAYSTVDKALYVSATGTSLNDTTEGAYVVSSANAIAAGDLEFVIAGTNGDDVLKGGAGKDTITGGAGADKINGGAGSDSYQYAVASESTIINAASTATGFDTVTITSGDVFDFISDVTAVRVDEYYVGQSPQANGDALLVQLNSFYQSAGPSAGVDAMYISIGNNAKGRFLVVDTDDNNQITSNDLIIEIVGITANKNIQLGLSGGNVVMNEVDPPSFI